jgi:glycolate oxidase
MEKKYQLRCANVFHAGDGNLHPLILFDANDADQLQPLRAVWRRHPGNQRGHGRHRDRRAWRGRGKAQQHVCAVLAQENEQMFGVKRAFDPAKGLLNPGKVIPTLNRCAEYGKMLVRGGQIAHPDLPRF